MKRIIFVTCLLFGCSASYAQGNWHFVATLTKSGDCGMSLREGYIWASQVEHFVAQDNARTFGSESECRACREELLALFNGTRGGCTTRVTASKCSRVGGGVDPSSLIGNSILYGDQGYVFVMGQTIGGSFYSTNPANEIKDWSSDDMERRLALNPDYPYFDPANVPTGDSEFDSAINEINISMPGDFDLIEKPNDNSNQDLEDYMIVGGTRIPVSVLNKPFDPKVLGEVHSDDLDTFEDVWLLVKKSRNLPDNDVYAFRDRMLSESHELLQDLLNHFNMTSTNLSNYLGFWNRNLQDWYLRYNSAYEREYKTTEQVYELLNFIVVYKNRKISQFIEKHSQDHSNAQLGDRLAELTSSWVRNNAERNKELANTRDEEKELIEKYGIPESTIKALKERVDKESIENLMQSISGTGVISGATTVGAEFLDNRAKEDMINKEPFSPEEQSFEKMIADVMNGVPLGVVVGESIIEYGYIIERDAKERHLNSIRDEYKKNNEHHKQQDQKIQDLSLLVSSESESRDNTEYKQVVLNKASRLYYNLSRIKERFGKNDGDDVLPDISGKDYLIIRSKYNRQ